MIFSIGVIKAVDGAACVAVRVVCIIGICIVGVLVAIVVVSVVGFVVANVVSPPVKIFFGVVVDLEIGASLVIESTFDIRVGIDVTESVIAVIFVVLPINLDVTLEEVEVFVTENFVVVVGVV